MAQPVYSIKKRRHGVLLRVSIPTKPGERILARYHLDSETEALALLFCYFPDAEPAAAPSTPIVA